jgi:hypothetical protein
MQAAGAVTAERVAVLVTRAAKGMQVERVVKTEGVAEREERAEAVREGDMSRK